MADEAEMWLILLVPCPRVSWISYLCNLSVCRLEPIERMKTRLKYLIVLVLLSGCAGVTNDQDVRLIRDEWGTPHVYADTIYGLYYGYGYAIAQDRLFQMEMAKRSTQGTVAEVLGADFIEYDKTTRALFKPESIRSQLDALMAEDRGVFTGYAAGMNAWLNEIEKDPTNLLSKQFHDLAFNPSLWTDYDVAMIFIGTMNNRFGDFNTELDNLAIYNVLKDKHGPELGTALFNLLNPRFTQSGVTTIPTTDWSEPAYDSMAATVDPDLPLALTEITLADTITGFSNCFVLGRDKVKGGGSILVNGPQFGWFNPSYVYSIGLHGAGIDVAGNSPFGYPMIMFGHNGKIAWGSTWGASDIVDIYAHKLNQQGEYLYKGNWQALEHRWERIEVKNGKAIDHEVFRSVYGPITHMDKTHNIAYAKHRSWDGRELDNLISWLRSSRAQDFESWKAQAMESTINVNLYFADVDGNIGYFHSGYFPLRAQGHDNRLPVTGDGSMDWRGRQDFSANPHVLNPSSGYLANWNNKPGDGVMNPDHHFYSWSRADRHDTLEEVLTGLNVYAPNDAWDVLEKTSYNDMTISYFLPFMEEAAIRIDDPEIAGAITRLRAWDGRYTDTDEDGFYDDSAIPLYRAFLKHLVPDVLRDDLIDAYPYFASSGYGEINIPTGIKAIIRALDGDSDFDIFNGRDPNDVLLATLRKAIEDAEPVAVIGHNYATSNFMGVPQAGEAEKMSWPLQQNRGTENNMIVLRPGAIEAFEIAPPGQSGFIRVDGSRSPHYEDQFELYHRFGRKQLWFYKNEVESHAVSDELIR
jgi:penicillin amidase